MAAAWLLDTCTFLWAAADPDKLSARAKEICEDPQNSLLVSVVSAWEILIKAQKGMLDVPRPVVEWCTEQAAGLQVRWLELGTRHLTKLESLPHIHKGPFDRLIVAQSMAEGCSLVTCDKILELYD